MVKKKPVSQKQPQHAAPPRAPRSSPADRSIPILFVAIVVFIISCLLMMPFVPEDSYISFRYAEHFADGEGLTFSRGEPAVEGYSNFLWLVVCGIIYKMGFHLPTATPYAGMILGILNLFMLWLLFKRRDVPPLQMVLPLLVFATAGPFVMYAVSGMEMPLFSLLLFLMVFFAEEYLDKASPVGLTGMTVTGLLLSLCRPEGVIVFPIVVAFVFWKLRRDTERKKILNQLLIAGAVFAVCMVGYHLWRHSYFNEWLPPPLLSKGGGGRGVFFAWKRNFVMFFYTKENTYPPTGYFFAVLSLFAVLGAWYARGKEAFRGSEHLALIIVLVLMAVYSVFVDWMPGGRYQSVLIGLMLLPAVHVQWAFSDSMWRAATRPELKRYWAVVAIVLLLSYTVFANLKVIGSKLEVGNQECLIPLANWLGDVMPRGALLAMSDVGAVPYYSRLRTVDIHVESLTDLEIAKNGFSIDYVLSQHPDVVVLAARSIFSVKMDPNHYVLYKHPGFGGTYRFVGTVRYIWYEDRCYWVFVRRDMTLTEDQLKEFPGGIGTMRRLER